MFSFRTNASDYVEPALNSEITNVEVKFFPNRIFMNQVDSYHGKYIAKVLGKMLVSPPVDEIDEEQPYSKAEEAIHEEMENLSALVEPKPAPEAYDVVGTIKNPEILRVEGVKQIVSFDEITKCGYIVYDVNLDTVEVDKLAQYLIVLNEEYKQLKENNMNVYMKLINKQTFILLSTVMTWALTKPIDPDDPDLPFTEEDFRKRKPHPNFKAHCDLEKSLIKLSKTYPEKISAIVIGCGVTYGMEEDSFHYWFQHAWENIPLLPIIRKGLNKIPLLYIKDLCEVVSRVILLFPKLRPYLLAVEPTATTHKEIVKSLGNGLGTGKFKVIPMEEAMALKDITQRAFDCNTVNLYMEPTYFIEEDPIDFGGEMSFSEKIPKLFHEFKNARKLRSFKVVVHGPPASGKTLLSKQICENYGSVYLSLETLYDDYVKDLQWRISLVEEQNRLKEERQNAIPLEGLNEDIYEDNEEDEEEPEDIAEIQEQLATLTHMGVIPSDEVVMYIRNKMKTNECINRGWVLDGFPSTYKEAVELFRKDDDDEDEYLEPEDELVNKFANVSRKLLPDLAVSLQAPDNFLSERLMLLSEEELRASGYNEDILTIRFKKYHDHNTDTISPLDVLDQVDIHPLIIELTKDKKDAERIFNTVVNALGKPCRYGKYEEIIERMEKQEREKNDIRLSEEGRYRKVLEEQLKNEKLDRMETWTELYHLMKDEEEQILVGRSEPLRHYLVKFIFPTLTQALLQVAKLRPEDPIDFLAEYLFRENPTGRMFEPGYNLKAEYLLKKLKVMKDMTAKKAEEDEMDSETTPTHVGPHPTPTSK